VAAPVEEEVAASVEEPEVAPENEEHAKLQRDLEELSAKASKADEYLELAQRTKADFENYRKRAAREAAVAQDRGVAKLAKELLPAVDNLDRALEAAEAAGQANGADTLASGIKLVHADVIAALSRAGIERYSPEGEV
jgi:molecular chaperone GrpE